MSDCSPCSDRPRLVVSRQVSRLVQQIDRGPPGPQGPPGSGGVTVVIPSPLLQWTVAHNLGYEPSVELLDAGGQEFDADVHHLSVNVVQITMLVATSGKIRLN